jgi:hypothetical protein
MVVRAPEVDFAAPEVGFGALEVDFSAPELEFRALEVDFISVGFRTASAALFFVFIIKLSVNQSINK